MKTLRYLLLAMFVLAPTLAVAQDVPLDSVVVVVNGVVYPSYEALFPTRRCSASSSMRAARRAAPACRDRAGYCLRGDEFWSICRPNR